MALLTIAFLLAVFGLVPYVLQARKVLIRRSARGLSFGYCLMLTWSSAIWIAHGSFCRNWVQIAIEGASLAICMVLLLAFMRYERTRMLPGMLATLAFAVALIAACMAGSVVVSFVALAMPIACRLPQVVRTFLGGDALAVSVPAFLIAMAVELLWVINGFMVGDIVTVAAAGVCATEALLVALRCSYGRIHSQSHEWTGNQIATPATPEQIAA
jgi:uncharacterized protein with PQ loop repeat